MRKIDYLELMDFVKAKQAFSLRWINRYNLMNRLYWAKMQLIRSDMQRLWSLDRTLSKAEYAQLQLLENDLDHFRDKLERCRTRRDVLMRYGQYFSQLPFRLLDKNGKIPDCFWYVPDPINNQ
ncbi:hypothetical protein ACAW74_18275 [Fibrella sp. WM1]|uniref:hypothetical protein n=1 Tax=Fibrella musci TaxID=3242485 RepID=UPI00351FC73D